MIKRDMTDVANNTANSDQILMLESENLVLEYQTTYV